jgi:hypothetical protein
VAGVLLNPFPGWAGPPGSRRAMTSDGDIGAFDRQYIAEKRRPWRSVSCIVWIHGVAALHPSTMRRAVSPWIS